MSHDGGHILIVDDDPALLRLLQRYLNEQGFRTTTALSAAEARSKLAAFAFDLLVLDIMMPGESGLELTRSLRRVSAVPILLLTAMNEAADRIAGFESGADDYLAKPFEPRELVLRITAVLRRVAQAAEAEEAVSFGDFSFDLKREELKRGELYIKLTAGEASLLKALARQPGVPISREALNAATGFAENARAMDVQVTRLRRKIEDDPKFPRYLQTVRGTGYILMPD